MCICSCVVSGRGLTCRTSLQLLCLSCTCRVVRVFLPKKLTSASTHSAAKHFTKSTICTGTSARSTALFFLDGLTFPCMLTRIDYMYFRAGFCMDTRYVCISHCTFSFFFFIKFCGLLTYSIKLKLYMTFFQNSNLVN